MAGRLDGIIVGNPDLIFGEEPERRAALLWDNNDDLNAGVTLFNTDFNRTKLRKFAETAAPIPPVRLAVDSDLAADRVNVDKANMRG